MSYCIWMGWFSAFNQTRAQLLNVIVALINRDHGVISASQWAPACCHAVHSHPLPAMDFNGFLASYSGLTCWERRAHRSTLKQYRTVCEPLLLTCKHIQICTRNCIRNIQALHTVYVLHFSVRYTLRCSVWIFRFSIFTIIWSIVRTFLNVYFFPTIQNYFSPGGFPGSYRAHLAVFGFFFFLLLSSPRLPIPTFRFPQLTAAIN